MQDVYKIQNMPNGCTDVAARIIKAQDDPDTVLLPNACMGQLIELKDGTQIRCFSILTRQPHLVPPESWSMISTPNAMTPVKTASGVVDDKIMIDHVTRGIIGDSAIQVQLSQHGNIDALRLLPPAAGSAQQYWSAQAKRRLES